MSCVELVAHQQPTWVIQPLVEAGLDAEQICALLFRLAFDAIVGVGVDAGLTSAVIDQPTEVQAAWLETVGRMLTLPAPAR
jgi:hypothetical protein